MATRTMIAPRRFAGFLFTLLVSLCLCGVALSQQGASPLVTSTVATGLGAPPTYGAVWNSAVTSRGDFVIADFENAAVYQYPPGGAAPVTVFKSGSLFPGGDWANNSITIDPWNNLWLDNNWNGGLQRVPWDAATGTWDTSKATNPGSSLDIGGYYFQSAGLAVNSSGTFALSTENGAPQPALYQFTIDSTGATSNLKTVVTKLSGRARALAIDSTGNIYIWEDGGLPGVLMVPAGVSGLATDKDPQVMRVDPVVMGSSPTAWVLTSITGVAVDASGNLYIGDSSAGVFMVPNQSGTLNPNAWSMITPVTASGQISIDQARDTLYVPTSANWNGIVDVAAVGLGSGELGSAAVGMAGASSVPVYYSFSGTGTVTPARWILQENGAATSDFAVVSGGTCAAGTTYPIAATASQNAVTSCSLNVSLTPQHLGSVSAQLLMQTSQLVKGQTVYTTVATTTLHGTGLAGAIETTPALESAMGSHLKTPSQMATDSMGNLYVADPGQGKVLMYAADSSAAPVSIGTGLTAPTGVAVDGGGNVYIGDSGNVYEVPYGPTGLNAAGQLTVAVATGDNSMSLAVDGLGHLYVADPSGGSVDEFYNLGGYQGAFGPGALPLTAGLKAPSGVAVDSANNLYVIDGANLFKYTAGVQSTLLTNLSNATGVAVDASGAVYIASSGGTVRIPLIGGALDPSKQTTVAASVTSPTAVAIDNMGNAYLADGTAGNVHVVSASGSLNFGNVPLGMQPVLDATVTNDGNAALTITGYTSTNAVDYTAADGTCVGDSPIAPADSCMVNVTLAPGPGEQGTLTGQIGIASNAANGPITVNATGVGAPLAVSVSALSVAGTSEVVSTQVTVTVKPKSGTTVPTGQVVVSFTTITGATATVSGTLTNGSATLTLAPVAAGNQKISVEYIGDRVYGRSTATATAAIARSAIAALALPKNPPSYLPYVLEADGSTPYDGSADYWEYNLVVTVSAGVGQPTGTVSFNEGSSLACSGGAVQTLNPQGTATFATDCLVIPPNSSFTQIVAAHTVTPVYSGDANFLPFTGQPVTFQVVRSPALTITSSPASLSVTAGTPASADLTLTSILGYGFAGKNQQLNDYNFPVSLGCDNLPPHATCSFTYPNPDPNTPNSVDIPCTGTTAAADDCAPGKVTVTINTNVPVGTTAQIAPRTPITLAVLFGFGMIGLFFRRRAAEKGRLLLMLVLVVLGGALAVSLTACGTTNLSPASVLNTPPGTYAVTVTAQQVGSQVITLPTGPITIYGSQNQVSLPFTLSVTVK